MPAPANIRESTGILRPTAFRPGQSGNPKGRTPGTRNKVTTEARETASRLVDDPEYRANLRQRMIDGTAGAMEPLLWFYAKGKPVERVNEARDEIHELTNEELKAKLLSAIKTLEG
jgi:hypothetical protein